MDRYSDFQAYLDLRGLRVAFIKTSWYLEMHPESLDPDRDLGLVIYSDRRFFEGPVLDEYESSFNDPTNIIDRTVKLVIENAVRFLPFPAEVHFVDKPASSPRKYIHAQTLGLLGGFAQWISPSKEMREAMKEGLRASRDPLMWGGHIEHVLGVTIHKELGGWFAYRALIAVKDDDLCKQLIKPERLHFIENEVKYLKAFNLLPECGSWRERPQQDPRFRYGPLQFVFFASTELEERRKILDLCIAARNFLSGRVISFYFRVKV
jgi:hypothetical protein